MTPERRTGNDSAFVWFPKTLSYLQQFGNDVIDSDNYITQNITSCFIAHQHVVLRYKETLTDRPHGHIMQAKAGLVPDESIVSTNPFAYCFGPRKVTINGRAVTFETEENDYRKGGAVIPKDLFKSMLSKENNVVEIVM